MSDYSTDVLLGERTTDPFPDHLYGLSKPRDIKASDRIPLLRYQRQFQDFWSMIRGKWDFGDGPVSVSYGENPVQHTNIVGSVALGPHIQSRYSGTAMFTDAGSLPAPTDISSVRQGLIYSDKQLSEDTSYSLLNLPEALTFFLDEQGLRNIRDNVNSGVYDYISWNFVDYYHDFYYTMYKGSIVLAYAWTIGSWAGSKMWWDSYLMYKQISFTHNRPIVPIATGFPVSDLASAVCTSYYHQLISNAVSPDGLDVIEDVRSTCIPNTNWPFSGLSVLAPSVISLPVYLLSPVGEVEFFDLVGYDLPHAVYVENSGRSTITDFHHICEEKFPRCVAGNAISSIDAINGHFGTLSSSDNIEAAVELGDILSPIDVGKAVYQLLKRRNVSIARLLDILTDAKLTYSFGLAPTIDDAIEVAHNLKTFRNKMRDKHLYGPNTLYGSRRYVLDNYEFGPFNKVTVVCRSKIRVKSNADTLLPYILPPRSLGLLPSLSSAWNLLPFSFVADWLTRTGSSLSLLEDQTILMMLNVQYSVHSITIHYNFSDDDEEAYHFSVTDGGVSSAGYKYYARYVLNRTYPSIGPTLLPIIGDVGIPDFGTAGALLYKRI